MDENQRAIRAFDTSQPARNQPTDFASARTTRRRVKSPRAVTPDVKGHYQHNMDEHGRFKVGGAAGLVGRGTLMLGEGTANWINSRGETIGAVRDESIDRWFGTQLSQRSKDVNEFRERSAQADKSFRDALEARNRGEISIEQFREAQKDAQEAYKFDLEQYDVTGSVFDMAEVASLPLALSPLRGLSAGTKAAFQTRGAWGTVGRAVIKMDDAMAKIPSLRASYARKLSSAPAADRAVNLGKLATSGKLLNSPAGKQEITKDLLTGALYRMPFNIGFTRVEAEEIWNAAFKGEFGKAGAGLALIGTYAAKGGIFGLAISGVGKVGKATKVAMFGRKSFADELFKETKDGVNGLFQYLDDLAKRNPELQQKYLDALRNSQKWNIDNFGDGVLGAKGVVAYYRSLNIDVSTWTSKELLDDMYRHFRGSALIQDAISKGQVKGIDPLEAKNYSAVRFDKETKNNLIAALEGTYKKGGGGKAARIGILEQARAEGVPWASNTKLYNKLAKDIGNKGKKELLNSIKKIRVASMVDEGRWTKEQLRELSRLGYLPGKIHGNKTVVAEASSLDKIRTQQLPKINGNVVENFDIATQPVPIFSAAGGLMKQLGISPEDTTRATYNAIKDNISRSIADLNLHIFDRTGAFKTVSGKVIDDEGRFVTNRLQQHIQKMADRRPFNQPPVMDVRQLKPKEIMEAFSDVGLTLSKADAKNIRGALMQAYSAVPLQMRGMGDKIIDKIMAAPVIGTPYRVWLRVAGQYRYAYNPFFRLQEQVETSALTGAGIFKMAPGEMDGAVKTLERANLFTAEMGARGFGSFATDDLALGAITANLSKFQKRNLAGLATSMARKQGLTLDQMIKKNPDQLADALRVTVQYKATGPLNSPLARTLNLAVFPSRYNMKVAGITANAMSKLPVAAQLATVNAAFEMRDWLGSPEGIEWQSKHAGVIGLLGWLTPIGTLEWAWTNIFNQDKIGGPGDLGLIGGVPLGFFTQILESQGIIDINSPYVNPKTGEAYSDRIPVSSRGQLHQALLDLIMSTFSFPGRTVGLPGKRAITEGVLENFTGADRGDFRYELNEEAITEYDRRVMEVLENGDVVEHEITYRQPSVGYGMPGIITRPVEKRELERRKDLPSKTNSRGQTGTYLPDGSRRVISRVSFD